MTTDQDGGGQDFWLYVWMYVTNGLLDCTVQVLARLCCADPFLGNLDLALPPIGACDWPGYLYTCGESFFYQGVSDLFGTLVCVYGCIYLNEVCGHLLVPRCDFRLVFIISSNLVWEVVRVLWFRN